MTPFERAFKKLLGIEGEYSKHPADSGGATRWGVTEFLARRYGYTGEMQYLPLTMAQSIYRREFWERLRLDEIAQLSEAIAEEMFDTEVNTPAGTAIVFLQRSLNVLNREHQDYADLKIDGRMGPATIDALRAYLAKRGRMGETVLLRALNVLQGTHYIELAERRQKDEAFVLGWLLNRVRIGTER